MLSPRHGHLFPKFFTDRRIRRAQKDKARPSERMMCSWTSVRSERVQVHRRVSIMSDGTSEKETSCLANGATLAASPLASPPDCNAEVRAMEVSWFRNRQASAWRPTVAMTSGSTSRMQAPRPTRDAS